MTTTPPTPNPLLAPWDTPYGLPPFDAVRAEDFLPAFEQAMREHRAELDAIAAAGVEPDFDNTVTAFDRSGRLLVRLASLFHNLASSETSTALQAVERELAPLHGGARQRDLPQRGPLRAHRGAARTARDRGLDGRAAADGRAHPPRLRARWRAARARGGAAPRRAQAAARAAADRLRPERARRRGRLPPRVARRGRPGRPARLRARRGARGGARARQRCRRRDHAVALAHRALPHLQRPARPARAGLARVDDARRARRRARQPAPSRPRSSRCATSWRGCTDTPATPTSRSPTPWPARRTPCSGCSTASGSRPSRAPRDEAQALRGMQLAHGATHEIEPWDWRHLAERVRQARYGIDEAQVKPYFPLARMVEAAFECAERLFGLRFVEQPQVRAYHPDVKVYEVRGADDRLVGVFLHDNFARPSKRSGAWMSSYREQSRHGGGVLPIVVNNNNFAKGAPGEPTLLQLRRRAHAVPRVRPRAARPAVRRDLRAAVGHQRAARLRRAAVADLRALARGPGRAARATRATTRTASRSRPSWCDRLLDARTFNQGYETVRYAASAIVDLAAHARTDGDRCPTSRRSRPRSCSASACRRRSA